MVTGCLQGFVEGSLMSVPRETAVSGHYSDDWLLFQLMIFMNGHDFGFT